MAGAEADEGIFFGESCLKFVVALEMTLVENLDSVFLSRCAVCAMNHL